MLLHLFNTFIKTTFKQESLLLGIRYPKSGIKESHNIELLAWKQKNCLCNISSSFLAAIRLPGKRNWAAQQLGSLIHQSNTVRILLQAHLP